MITAAPDVEVRHVTSVEDALEQLAALGELGAPLAGGTWIMRAPLRGEPLRRTYVALAGAVELRRIEVGEETVEIGALVTHAELATAVLPPALAGLATAAGLSAFPAVRNVATVGGNLCARGFAEADIVPALLAADAVVRVRSATGRRDVPMAAFLAAQGAGAGELVAGVGVPAPAGRRAGFERLIVRGAAEYAIAAVAVSVDMADGVVERARVAVGSVEPVARLCEEAAAALVGAPLDERRAEAAGEEAAQVCAGRDGLDAPGWYREAVLPALVRGAVAQIIGGGGS